MKRNTERQMKALVRRVADVKKCKTALKSKEYGTILLKSHKYAQAVKSKHEEIVKAKLKSAEKDVAILKEKLKTEGVDTAKLSGEKKASTDPSEVKKDV